MASGEVTTAARFLPEKRNLKSLRQAAKECRGCDLYRRATQTVFGAGPDSAAILFVGEQPGDQEDKAGEPFVGPAGRLLDLCMEEAGIRRNTAYVTNAVKHFKWEPRGTRRIHKKPRLSEVNACHAWLEAEINAVRPKLIVCLGATAAQSLLGPHFRVTHSRGRLLEVAGYPPVLATVHPSAILRSQSSEDRERERGLFIQDLAAAARFLTSN